MKFVVRAVISLVFSAGLVALLLLVPAGTWHWGRAWGMIAVVAVATVGMMAAAFWRDEELLRERQRGLFQHGQPAADKVVLALFVTALYAQVISIPLDVWRWHLLARPRPWVSVLGMGMFIMGWWLMTLVFRQNSFAAPVVKHMKERGQRVIDTGVYAVVRHPMYVGVALMLPGMALWLGSTAAALFSLVPTGLLVLRIGIEERFLSRELPGYADYTRRVRWRLVPGVW